MLKDNKNHIKIILLDWFKSEKKNTVLELLELDCVRINSSTKFIPYL